MKKVSIIIPTYNSEKTIKKCIKSVIEQTYKNIEIIVINDGSTDKTSQIIKEYAKIDKRIIIINQKNHGVSYSRNYGVKICTGQYITFIDADDWIDKEFIEKLLNNIEEKKVDFVRCNYYIENKDSTAKAKMYDLSNLVISKKEILDSTIFSHFLYNIEPINNYVMLLFIKSDIIKNKIFFDTDLYMMEDVMFYIELFLNSKKYYFLDECLYHYNNTSISATRDVERASKNIKGIIEAITKIKKHLKNNDIEYNETYLNYNCINLIINYLEKIPYNNLNEKFNNIMDNLNKNPDFIDIINNCDTSRLNLYRKVIVHMLRKKHILCVKLLFKIRKIKER